MQRPPRPYLRFNVALLTCGYLGFLPRYMRGICAAFLAVPALHGLLLLTNDVALRAMIFACAIVLVSVFSWHAVCRVLPQPPHDEEFIVIDEFLGGLLACAAMLVVDAPSWFPFAAASVFCIFDYFKPFGIQRIDDWPVPVAVVLDDVAAGILACTIATASLLLLPA